MSEGGGEQKKKKTGDELCFIGCGFMAALVIAGAFLAYNYLQWQHLERIKTSELEVERSKHYQEQKP